MSADEIRELLRKLQLGVGQPSVALKCNCDNLETVYVSLSPDDAVLVSDAGQTFAYLSPGVDAHHRPVEELDMAAVEGACRRAGVGFWREDPESYPRIECVVESAVPVAEVIERVAAAVDEVFHLAYRDRLR